MSRLLTALLFVLVLLPLSGGGTRTLLTIEGPGVVAGDTLRLARVIYGDTLATIPVISDGEADAVVEIAGPDTLYIYSAADDNRLRPITLTGGHVRTRLYRTE